MAGEDTFCQEESSAVGVDQFLQRGTTFQSPYRVIEGNPDPRPGFSMSARDWSRIAIRPGSMFTFIGFCPLYNLGFRKRRQGEVDPSPPLCRPELAQRHPSRQAASSLLEGVLDSVPGFAGCPVDRTRPDGGPFTGPSMILIAPGEDLLDG